MWALLILPQQRRMRKHQVVISSLRAGDEVVTAGGVYGVITSVDDETLAVEVAPGVVLRVLRTAVTSRVGPLDEDDDMIQTDEDTDTDDDTQPVAEAAAGEDDL